MVNSNIKYYWIDPDGDFISVGNHGKFAQNKTHMDATMPGDPGFQEMYRMGYIKATHQGTDLKLDDGNNKVDPRQWNRLQKTAVRDFVRYNGLTPKDSHSPKEPSSPSYFYIKENKSNTSELKQAIKDLYWYLSEKLGIEHTPRVVLASNNKNANEKFGKTGYYDPVEYIIKIYITDRHQTDILRSFSHEVIHHWQNLRGQLPLAGTDQQYAQKNIQLRKKEMEAYLLGNILFRDWQDQNRYGEPTQAPFLVSLNENLAITNSTRLKDLVTELIQRLVSEKIITSYHRDRSSGDMDPGDFVEEFSHKIYSDLESLVQHINDKGNWESQGEMVQ